MSPAASSERVAGGLRLSADEAIVASLVSISAAIQWNDGELARGALALVTAGLLCCLWSLLSDGRGLRWAVPCAALLYEVYALLTSLPFVGPADLGVFRVVISLSAAAALAACALPRLGWRQLALVAAVAGVFAAGVLMLRSSPRPPIDVYEFQQEASKVLFAGANPYEIRVRDIYDEHQSKIVYGPGVSLGGYLTVGFPYPPVSLFISSLGYLGAGDTRYAHLAVVCLAALLFAFACPGRTGIVAALLFLFCPRVFYVIGSDWTEPVLIFLLSLTVFCRCRFPKAAPWIIGLLLAGKQYMIFTAPALVHRWKEVPKAMLAGALLTAPLVFWNIRDFVNSVVLLQFAQPTRGDALSYMALLARYGIRMPGWVAFALTAAAIVLILYKAPVTTSASCCAASLVLLVFFMFNKAAFCNYYYLVIGVLAGGLAATDHPETTAPPALS